MDVKVSKRLSAILLSFLVSSAASAATCPAGGVAPSAPINLAQVSAMDANVQWDAPANKGGAAITAYIPITSSDNGVSWTKGVAMQQIAGLKGYITAKSGTVMLVKVTAQNACGMSPSTPTITWVAP